MTSLVACLQPAVVDFNCIRGLQFFVQPLYWQPCLHAFRAETMVDGLPRARRFAEIMAGNYLYFLYVFHLCLGFCPVKLNFLLSSPSFDRVVSDPEAEGFWQILWKKSEVGPGLSRGNEINDFHKKNDFAEIPLAAKITEKNRFPNGLKR